MQENIDLNQSSATQNDKQNLTDSEKQILRELSKEPEGYQYEKAPSYIAEYTLCSTEKSQKMLSSLLANEYIVLKDKRYHINNNLIGTSYTEYDCTNVIELKDLGRPHLTKATDSLDNLLKNERNDLYIYLNITPPIVFKSLDARASQGFLTYFIIPSKKLFEKNKHETYNSIMQEWDIFIKEGNAYRKKNIRILICKEPHKELYTSSINLYSARFDNYRLNSYSTREGRMYRAGNDSSFYHLVKNSYANAIQNSTIYFKLWPKEWIIAIIQKYYIFGILITLGIIIFYFCIESTFITSLLISLLSGLFLKGLDFLHKFDFSKCKHKGFFEKE